MAEDTIITTRNLPEPAVLKTPALVTEIYTTYKEFQTMPIQLEATPNATYFVPFYGDQGPANVPIVIKTYNQLMQFFKYDVSVSRYGWGAKQAADILANGSGTVHVLGYNLRPTFGGSYTDPDNPKAGQIQNSPGRHAISVLDVSISGITPDKVIKFRQRDYDPGGTSADYTLLSKLGNITAAFSNGASELDPDKKTTWYPLLVFMDKNPGESGNDVSYTITPYISILNTEVQMYKLNIINSEGITVVSKIFSFDKYFKFRNTMTYLPTVLEHIDNVHSIFVSSTYDYIMKELGIATDDMSRVDIFGSGSSVISVRQNPNDASSVKVNKTVQNMTFLTTELKAKYDKITFDENSLRVTDIKNPMRLRYGYSGEYTGDNSKDNLLTKLLSCEANTINSEGFNVGERDFESLKYQSRAFFDTIFDHGHYDLKHMELLMSLRGFRAEYNYDGANTHRSICVMNAKGFNETQVTRFMESLGGGSGIRQNDVLWLHGYAKIDYDGKYEDVSTSYQECMKQVAIDVDGPFYFSYGESRFKKNGILNGIIDDNNIFLRKDASAYYLTKYGLNILNKNSQGDVFVCNNKTSTTKTNDVRYFFDINRTLIYIYNNVESIVKKYQSPEGLSIGDEAAVLNELATFLRSIPTKVLSSFSLPAIVSTPMERQNGVYIIASTLAFKNNAIKFVFDFTAEMSDQ